MFKLNAKFDADSLLYSLSHFGCDGHTAHMLTHGHLPPPLYSEVVIVHIPIYSPWLPGYIDTTQTVLIICTMVRLFPDKHLYMQREREREVGKPITSDSW